MLRIREAALDRTDGLAGLVLVEAHAFGAKLRIDDVDVLAGGDGFVRALGLACSTVDAVGRDVRGHLRFLTGCGGWWLVTVSGRVSRCIAPRRTHRRGWSRARSPRRSCPGGTSRPATARHPAAARSSSSCR